MFLKINKFTKTVTFRTAFAYSVLFMLSLVIIFSVLYIFLDNYIITTIDYDLKLLIGRFEKAYSGRLYEDEINIDHDSLKEAPEPLRKIALQTIPGLVIYKFELVHGESELFYEFEGVADGMEYGIMLDRSGQLAGLEKAPIAKGVKALKKEIKYQEQTLGSSNVLFFLTTADGRFIAGPVPNIFQKAEPYLSQIIKEESRGPDCYRTLLLPDRHIPVRAVIHVFADGHKLIIAHNLNKEKKLLINYLKIIGFSLVLTLCCSSIIGYWVATRSMSGVKRVTAIADRINQGNLDCQVAVRNEGEEIVILVNSFNKMLERIRSLIQELNSVTDNLAHDLKTPITGIRARIESLLIRGDTPDSEAAEKVLDDCDRMISLIDTTLETAELRSGITELARDEIDLNKILRLAYELFSPVAEDKGLRFSLSVPDRVLTILGDARKLQRLIANLIDNAIKYTDQGEIILTAEKKSDQIIFSVSDTGIGIEPGELNRIFEKFYRCDQSRATPGYGLGFSFVKAVADVYDWKISVSSVPSAGTVVKLVIPLSPAVAVPSR